MPTIDRVVLVFVILVDSFYEKKMAFAVAPLKNLSVMMIARAFVANTNKSNLHKRFG